MTNARARRALTFAFVLGAPACQGGGAATGPAPVSAAAAARRFAISERAETGPITAISYRAPFLYAGTAHGRRRWDVTSDEYEDLGGALGSLGRAVTALGLDGEGNAWVATDSGVGRLARGKKADA